MAMVTSVKKSGRGNKVAMSGRKLPFLDLYLVRGVEIRRRRQSSAIATKILGKLLAENRSLKKRLARWEG